MNGVVIEAVLPELNDKHSILFSKKVFGKILTPKESFDDVGEFPEEYLTRYISISYSKLRRTDDEVDKFNKLIHRKVKISIDDILDILHKVFHRNFSLLVQSNLRLVFARGSIRRGLVEIRYDKRLFNNGNKDTSADPVQLANHFKDDDYKNIFGKSQVVRNGMSNTVTPVIPESIDVDKIQKESGVPMPVAKEASKVSSDLFNKAYSNEPDITKSILDIVKSNHGYMYGLPFRLKQPTSLGRKICSDAYASDTNFNGDLSKAARDIKDSIRYIMIYPIDTFTSMYFETKKKLESLKYVEVRCKNFYTRFKNHDSLQKAVQCVYRSPKGILFELQFHTEISMQAKEVNHPLYEQYRSDSTDPLNSDVLAERMRNISSNVTDPAGVFTILEHNELK